MHGIFTLLYRVQQQVHRLPSGWLGPCIQLAGLPLPSRAVPHWPTRRKKAAAPQLWQHRAPRLRPARIWAKWSDVFLLAARHTRQQQMAEEPRIPLQGSGFSMLSTDELYHPMG